METQELFRGRMIDHIQIVVRDLAKTRKFYDAVFATLKIPLGGEMKDFFWYDEFFVSTADSVAAQGKTTGRVHLAFQASSEDMVRAFYRNGLEAGGISNGEPGTRPYHPGYYAAFLLDPDGNNIEAVYHGEHQRSADAVKITFDA